MTPNYTAGVVCLLARLNEQNNPEVLFLRTTYRRGWALPGGLIDRNESPQAAVRREVFEELGIALAIDKPYRTSVATKLQAVTCFTAARLSATEVASIRPDSSEVLEVRWFPVDAMPKLDPEIAAVENTDAQQVKSLFA